MTVKSSVVLNLRSSGQVLPGIPVSRPMKCTSMVGMDHVSVARGVIGATKGADRAGTASVAQESKVLKSILGGGSILKRRVSDVCGKGIAKKELPTLPL
jgi:hypothetical protein